MLLHGHRVVRSALHRRVVGDDDDLAPADAADAGNYACGGRLAFVHVPGGKRAKLEERSSWIQQVVDALAGSELAARAVALRHLLAPAGPHRPERILELLDECAHPRVIAGEL